MAMWMLALVAPVQIVVGDLHGLNTLEHQPAKVMAMEGHFGAIRRRAAAPVRHSRRARQNGPLRGRDPEVASLILKHDLDAPLRGSTRSRADDRPPVEIVFWSFRIMVGLGLLMLGLGLLEPVRRWPRAALRLALAAPFRAGDGAGRLRRGDRRLGHHRGRAPALGDLRPAADRRRGLADRPARRAAPRWSRS